MSDETRKSASFDDLMQQMGVRPLASKGGGAGKKGRRRKGGGGSHAAPRAPSRPAESKGGRAAKAGGGAPPAPAPTPAEQAPAPAPTAPRARGAASKTAPPPTPGPTAAEVAALRAKLQHSADELEAARAEITRLQEAHDEVDAHRRSLQRALDAARGESVSAPPSLIESLTRRGLKGRDERRALLRSLVDARLEDGLLRWLQPIDAASVDAFLDDRVSLLGGCEHCPAAPGRAVVKVPSARCEVCEGSDVRRSVRQFVDACLNLGLTRVTIVGGSPKYHRQISELVQHRRLRLDLLPGTVRRSQKQADHDLAHCDVVLLWGGSILDHSISGLYQGRSGRARVLTVPHRGISRMLQQAAEELGKAGAT